VNGVFEFEQKLLDGRRAGLEAAAYLGLGSRNCGAPESESHPMHGRSWSIRQVRTLWTFEDLQFKDSECSSGGFDNIELLKRYTTVGMGPSHSNMNALRILARVTGKSPGEVAHCPSFIQFPCRT